MKDFPFNIPSEILFGDLGAMSPDSPVVEVNERAALEKGEIPEYWTEPYEPEEAARREKLLREYGLKVPELWFLESAKIQEVADLEVSKGGKNAL